MRILYLTSRMPYPPVGGDRYRVFHFIRAAANAGHEVHLLTFDTHARTAESIAPLAQLTASLGVVEMPSVLSAVRAMGALSDSRPFQLAYYESKRMRVRVEEALARVRPDVVYTHLFRMAPYALGAMRKASARWILDLTDVISSGISRSLPYRRGIDRWLHTEESRRIAGYERRIAPHFDRCWVISDFEARVLSAAAPEARVEVVPNGAEWDGSREVGSMAREPATLLFFGFQKIFHNRDAVRFLTEEIFPLVRVEVPEARLEIAGKASNSLGPWARGRDRKSTRLNSSHSAKSRMPSSA